jgi:transketolase
MYKGHMSDSALTQIRKDIMRIATRSKEGHIPSSFSILDILWVLYDRVLRIDPANPKDESRDRFVLSKGHASLGLYAVLAAKGFFSADEFDGFAKYDSCLGGHPDRNKVPGVEASTGSLGHGFPIAVGMALAQKIAKGKSRVFVLVGDGECNEGTIWESALLAAHHGLENLTCIVDYNHSTDRALMVGDLAEKFSSFGWDAVTIDGHDHEALFDALSGESSGKPRVIIAETIKGYGCEPMENNPEWHHKFPAPEQVEDLIAQVI